MMNKERIIEFIKDTVLPALELEFHVAVILIFFLYFVYTTDYGLLDVFLYSMIILCSQSRIRYIFRKQAVQNELE